MLLSCFQHIFMVFVPHCRWLCFFFFLSKFLHPEFTSQRCKYTLTEPPLPKMHVRTPRERHGSLMVSISACHPKRGAVVQERRRGPVVGHSLWTRPARVQSPWEGRIITCKNLALYIRDCISVSFGWDTKGRWSLLSGVYARGSKRSHTGGKCVTCHGLHILT